jgi:hypothetical protein
MALIPYPDPATLSEGARRILAMRRRISRACWRDPARCSSR